MMHGPTALPEARPHGGPDAHGAPLHDFSTNSNACGPCPDVLSAVQAADATRYPDPAYTALKQQLAQFHAVDASRIHLAASASEFIFRVTAVAARRPSAAVWLPRHAYGDYAQAARAHGLARAGSPVSAALAWVCEPSSPLGGVEAALAQLAMPRLAGAVAAAAPITVLDGAYQPLRLSGEPTLQGAQLDAVWQLFTPNKALGLTGVRAAYAVAPTDAGATAALLDALSPSWPIGAHGVALLEAWTRPSVQQWLAASLCTLSDWKQRQIGICESLGWDCIPSDTNFFCAAPGLSGHLPLDDALVALRAQGIKLRDAASFGLPGHVRVGVLSPAAQDALQIACQHLMKGMP
ncbi:MAG: aminotransferase class I/II-fold pyridoxal phosphate-dependent enzyme [Comamonadaceae bacterium]|nr:MAG: aminotransferase class I/II-fold pyridoxal phosphate-dependent enzyme [Comamonadaceae bacterium]